VDARSDLWSLAATLYQMVTGEVPRVIDLEDVPEKIRKVLAKALKSKPDARYQNATEFCVALKEVVGTAMPAVNMKDLRRGQCPECQSVNDVSRKFCERCGATLQLPCLSCEKEIGAWEAFCPECGCDTAEVLEHHRQQFEQQKERIQGLRKEYRHEEAQQLLGSMTTASQPQLASYREWAEEILGQCQQELADLEQQREQALAAADVAYREFNETEAIQLLEQVPVPFQNETVKEALDLCQQHLDRVQALRSEIHDHLKDHQFDGLSGTVEAFLALRPNDEAALKLQDKLRKHDKENELEIVVDLGSAVSGSPGKDPTVNQAIWGILKNYDTGGSNGLFLSPYIPANKLQAACLTCQVPHGESILGLIDHTVFGSAKKCLLFGAQGIYFHNDWTSAASGMFFVSYSDLVSYNIGKNKWGEIGLGSQLAISIIGGKFPLETEIQLLHELQAFFRGDTNRLPTEDVVDLVPRHFRPPSLLKSPAAGVEEAEPTTISIRNDVALESPAPVSKKNVTYDGRTVSGHLVLHQTDTYYVAAGRLLGPDKDGFHLFDSDCFGGEVVSGQNGQEVPFVISVSVTSGSWGIGVFRRMEDIPTVDPADWKGT
jgi:serine/threonine protein kinase